MKLATYKDGSRDGQLLVVSRDLSQAHYANGIATRMQQLLDDWGFLSPQLEDLYTQLNHGKLRHAFAFDAKLCMAPLPRAFQYADAGVPQAGDEFLGPMDSARVLSEAMGIDFEAGLAAITGDVAMGASAAQGLEAVRLLMLANGWKLREAAQAGTPAAAFGPVAVTPDELGEAWRGGRVQLALQSQWNGRKVGSCEAGPGMALHFGQLIEQLAKTRNVRAGSIVGSGAIASQDAGKGYGCIAEKRALELREDGAARTEFMKFADSIRIEMKGRDGQSVFGAIDQDVVAAASST